MSSKFVSITNPTVHIHSKPTQSSKTQTPSKLSFSSQVVESRITTRNPVRARAAAAARVTTAFYAPAQSKETLYELLGIEESGSSSFSDIKKAYKLMARKYHPDVSPPERVDEYTRRFIMVHEAYETLSDPQTRAVYDRNLAVGGSDFSFSPRKHRNKVHLTSLDSYSYTI